MAAVPARIVVMGVSGAGKSAVAAVLAERLGADFVEADDLHPPANIAKMSSGVALSDADRIPWLDRVADELAFRRTVVVACSALRRAYRDRLRARADDTVFIQLSPPPRVLMPRLEGRSHFMPSSLLPSQLATLEPLEADECGVALPGDEGSPGKTADTAISLLRRGAAQRTRCGLGSTPGSPRDKSRE